MFHTSFGRHLLKSLGKSMMDKETVEIFCSHCDWAHQSWLMRKHLYDENPYKEAIKHAHHAYFFSRLEKILQEYWMHEVSKLHDPAHQNGFDNLSVEYIFKSGAWSQEVKDKLRVLNKKMNKFAQNLKPARNKLLSHKDKNVILSGATLGCFDEGEDIMYFEALSEFANEVHLAAVGTPYMFDDLTQNDVACFMSTFTRGLA